MKNKEYFINMDGFKLHAKIDYPSEHGEKLPMVVLAHGLTGNMDEFHLQGITETITECGFACLRVELYGHGQSDGSLYNHNLNEWISELCFVVDYARKLEYVSGVILAGHSQGGLTAALVGGMKYDQLKGLILLSPAFNIPSDCRAGKFFGAESNPDRIPDELTFWGTHKISGNYIRVARSIHYESAIAAFENPVLIVHGEDDDAVLPKTSYEAADLYKNAKLSILKGDGHCYEHHLDKAKEAVKEFLCEC